MSSSALRLVVPAPEAFATIEEDYNPTIHHVTQEQALEAASELDERRFNVIGSIEQYSGVHPEHGRCIIIVTAMSDSVIIPMS